MERKVVDEFQGGHTYTFVFIMELDNKLIGLTCNVAISVFQEFEVKMHYDTEHASTFDKFKGKFHEDKVYELKRKLLGQQSFFKSMSESLVTASYLVPEIVAKQRQNLTGTLICLKVLNVLLT